MNLQRAACRLVDQLLEDEPTPEQPADQQARRYAQFTQDSAAGAPPGVREVARAAKQSARAAGMSGNAVYVHKDGYEWRVSDNYETGVGTFVYRLGEWFWRDPATGEDSKLEGGQAQALEAASIMFTG